jgi:transcriptional regulator with XRE-family HTH domain
MRSKIFQRILDSTPKEVEIFVDWYADLVVRINQLLLEKNISKKQLAENLEKKPSEISKWLSGEHNFTLRSLAKLSAELGEPLLEVPKRKTQTEFIGGYSRSIHTFVSYKKIEAPNTSSIKEWQQAKELNTYSNVG